MKLMLAAGVLISGVWAMTACTTPSPAKPEAVIETFMWDYTKAWNKHDAAAIAKNFYRMGQSVEEQTVTTTKTFADLVAQGYDHSDIHEIKGCITGPDTAWAGMKFTRLKTDGQPLPPKDRASSYDLRKFPDGWRITKLTGYDAAKPLACPAP